MRIMRSGHTKSPHFATILSIVGGGLAIFLYSCYTADPEFLRAAEGAMAFQVGAWTLALVMCVWMSPGKDLRISDPAVLVLGWTTLYFLYPTIFWLQGNVSKPLWLASNVGTSSAVFLMWLHGLFILGFISSYLFFWNRSPVFPQPANIKVLPRGWLLYLLPFSLPILETLIRFSTTGVLFPTLTHGEGADQVYQAVTAAQAKGGLLQLWEQIFYKFGYFALVIQGAGIGLILAHTVYSRRNLARNLLILGGGLLLSILLGGGERSSYITAYLIGLIIADLLVGPIAWRHLIVALGLVFLFFEFFGIFRNLRDQGYEYAFYQAWEELSLSGFDLPEFLGMLGKEAIGINVFKWPEGLNYLVDTCLRLIPSQIYPEKFALTTTVEVLGREIYGKLYERGMGVGGAMIVDGWRFCRTLGVPLLGALIGVIYALAQNWLSKDSRTRMKGPVLFKLVLVAGFYGASYQALRMELFDYVSGFLYFIFLPWIVFLYVSRSRRQTIWSEPITLKKLT
jgi:hypothetical protein